MKEDEPFDPAGIGLLGLIAAMPKAEDMANLVK
jgi:hypothetical protein